jgi:hypothetical protein
MKFKDLNLDDWEQLEEMMASEGFKTFTSKVIPALVNRFEQSLLSANIDDSSAGHRLTIEKARLEGAKALMKDITTFKGKRGTP